jgi:hypothetical protein
MGCSCLLEPTLRLGFWHDRQDLNLQPNNIIEHSNFVDAESVLWLSHPAESLDPALAELGRLVAEVDLHRVTDSRSLASLKPPQALHRISGKDNLIAHEHAKIPQKPDILQERWEIGNRDLTEILGPEGSTRYIQT